MTNMNMTKEDKQVAIREAMEHLEQAEELVRSVDNPYLNAYVVGHLDCQRVYMGRGLHEELENYLNDLDNEDEEGVED